MLNNNIRCISQSRLSTYINLCKGDLNNAICVYTNLQHRSALYFTIIQEIEIAFRNELSSKIELWLHQHHPNLTLYDYFCNHALAYLSKEGQKQLSKAINDVRYNHSLKLRKAKKGKLPQTPDHNDMISHLTFGFWVYLLEQDPQKSSHTQYWNTILVDLFQNRFSSNLNLYTRMKDVLKFRNNLYHQEPVWKGKNINTPEKALQNLEKKFNNFMTYLEMLSPERYVIVNESYNLTQIRQQIFQQKKFLDENETLRNILISPRLTN